MFYNAIKRYGWDNFEHKVLEDHLTREEAKKKEIYYIKKYDSFYNGYNRTFGGDLRICPSVKQYDRYTGEFIKEWDCTISAEQSLGIPNADISAVCNKKMKTAHNFYFTYDDLGLKLPKDTLKYINTNECIIPVAQYDLKGNFIKKYNSLTEASKELGIKHLIRLNTKTSFGYIWKELDRNNPAYPLKLSDDELECVKYDYQTKTVYQYSLDGKYLKKFDNANDAAKSLNVIAGNIAATCRKESFQSNKFLWRYADDGYEEFKNLPKDELIYIHKGSIPVYRYDLNGHLIKKYKSITEASNELGIATTNISKACNGSIKTSAHSIWRYNEESFSDKDLEIILHNKRKRKVIQYDINMKYINTYDSLAEASKETKIKDTSIVNCCKGKYNHAGGFKWEYAS